MGQTGIACLKLTEEREEWGLSPLAGTNWFVLLSAKSEPGLPGLFLMSETSGREKTEEVSILLQ